MATETSKTTTTFEKPAEKPAVTDRAPLAGESSDPAVHQLLAEKNGHQMNRDLLDPPVINKDALAKVDDEIAEIDDQLADLGFPQQSQADRKAGLEKAAAEEKKKADAVEKRRTERAATRAAAK